MAIAEQLTQLNTLRTQLATNLTAKGVDASAAEGLRNLVDKVKSIESLPKSKTYSVSNLGSSADYDAELISLDSAPRFVILQYKESTSATDWLYEMTALNVTGVYIHWRSDTLIQVQTNPRDYIYNATLTAYY